VAAIQGSPPAVYQPPNLTNRPRGADELTVLVHAGLSIFDTIGGLHPQLAEAVPSVENGLWRLLPDGSMETTWKLKNGALWHDGAPFTADDLVFALQVSSDPDLPAFKDAAFNAISGAEAVDPSTILIRWKEPFIRADQLFSVRIAIPLPKHILESQYAQTDKSNFINLPYWNDDFVGLGPYKIKEFDPACGSWSRPTIALSSASRRSTRSSSRRSPTTTRSSLRCCRAPSRSCWAAHFPSTRQSRCATAGQRARSYCRSSV